MTAMLFCKKKCYCLFAACFYTFIIPKYCKDIDKVKILKI